MAAEVVATGLYVPEGPVVLPDKRIAFVEQVQSRVSVYDGSKVEVIAVTGGAPNAVCLGSDGNLYAAQNGGVVGAWRSEPRTQPGIQRVGLEGSVEMVAASVGGVTTLAPNDLAFGPDGRLYFTDPAHGYDPVNKGEAGRLFALGSDGGELLLQLDPCYCNGCAFTPDGELLWVESYDRNLCKLVEGKRKLLSVLPENHIPDGLKVAEDGRIFIASVASHGITITAPNGEYLDLIYLDGDAVPTNCIFEGSVLWVTDFGPDFMAKPDGGRLWRVETDAVGAPIYAGAV